MSDVEIKLARVMERWKGCTKCDLHRTRSKIVYWGGHAKGRLAVIGEAPGVNEDEQGVPFVGQAGQLFDEICAEVPGGPEPWDLFVANTVGCRPPRNRKPSTEEWVACRGRLFAMLAVVKPRALLLLGSSALEALTPYQKVTEMRGQTISVKIPWKGGEVAISAVPTLHPGFLLRARDRAVRRLVVADIRQAWELAQSGSWLEGD